MKRALFAAGATFTAAAASWDSLRRCQPSEPVPITKTLEQHLRGRVKPYKDFPKKGITFLDIFPVFHDPTLARQICFKVAEHAEDNFGKIDAVIGLDSRGFLFGPMVAENLGCAFVPVRKKGKLPGPTLGISYGLEYGSDTVEIQTNSLPPNARVIIIDDLLATGGTMIAAHDLVRQTGAKIAACYAIIHLDVLKGSHKIEAPCFHLLNY